MLAIFCAAVLILLAALTGSSACAPAVTPSADPTPADATVAAGIRCEAGDTAMVRDVVYFGRNRPDGGTVSDAEWEAYLDSVVTPRFPAGFTVLEAEGHWRGQGGVVERERTHEEDSLSGSDRGDDRGLRRRPQRSAQPGEHAGHGQCHDAGARQREHPGQHGQRYDTLRLPVSGDRRAGTSHSCSGSFVFAPVSPP